MVSRLVIVPTVLVVAALALSSCSTGGPESGEFAISLVESGDVILSDEHIAAYVWKGHRLVLTLEGVEHWKSFLEYDRSHDPPTLKLGGLTRKEFILSVEGVEMYRGHFWSMVSSLMKSGVLLYDTSAVMEDELWITFSQFGEETGEDPRNHPAIRDYFEKQGKLIEDR